MTIVQLEYLLAVANCGSFSLAAEHCFVTQPSLSMQIKNLEEELGVVLLDRSKKPVIPTEAGEVVIRNAREAVRACNYVRESVLELQGEVAGRLRLGVIPTIAPYLLPRFMTDFVSRYPRVELEVSERVTPDIVRDISHDRLDVAIVAGGTCPEGFVEEELFDDRFFVYVSSSHPLYERTNVRIEDLDPGELVLLCEGHCLRDQVLELCQTPVQARSPYRFESGSLETVMRIVDCTGLVTVIPEMAVEYIPEAHRAQVKPLARGAASRKIAIVVRRTYVKRSLIEALRGSVLHSVQAGA